MTLKYYKFQPPSSKCLVRNALFFIHRIGNCVSVVP